MSKDEFYKWIGLLKEATKTFARMTVWRKRGCNCCMVNMKPISFGEHKNAIAYPVYNPPSHSFLILGDEKHVEGFLEDLGKK